MNTESKEEYDVNGMIFELFEGLYELDRSQFTLLKTLAEEAIKREELRRGRTVKENVEAGATSWATYSYVVGSLVDTAVKAQVRAQEMDKMLADEGILSYSQTQGDMSISVTKRSDAAPQSKRKYDMTLNDSDLELLGLAGYYTTRTKL